MLKNQNKKSVKKTEKTGPKKHKPKKKRRRKNQSAKIRAEKEWRKEYKEFKSLKDSFLEVFKELQQTPKYNLSKWAKKSENTETFYRLASIMLPRKVEAEAKTPRTIFIVNYPGEVPKTSDNKPGRNKQNKN